ncbi:MAG: FMN-binding protein [Promicromonosporaceae bacterium]|nr:FMN-binding protein [Promicromonosporaceae bacterium]
MKRIVTWVLATVGGVVLLLSYKTSTQAVGPQPLPQAGTQTQTQAPQTGQNPTQGSTSSGSGSLKDGTYTGNATDTPYGPVQVKITVSGGSVTAATATEYPQESFRDQQINQYAIPMLQQESAGTTNGNIDMVSGATYTSQGYIGSLQDALDQARA